LLEITQFHLMTPLLMLLLLLLLLPCHGCRVPPTPLSAAAMKVAGNHTISSDDTFADAAAVAPAAAMSWLQRAANVLVSSSAAAPFGLVAKLGAAGISRAARQGQQQQQQQRQQQPDSVSSLSYQSPGGLHCIGLRVQEHALHAVRHGAVIAVVPPELAQSTFFS
jgi:hypothetical protein